MRTLLRIVLCGCVLSSVVPAQRGHAGGGGGGFRGGGVASGGFRGSSGGGFRGTVGGGYRGGFGGGVYRGGYGGYGYGGYRGYGGYGYRGFGLGLYAGAYYSPWLYSSFGSWPYDYGYPSYGYGYGYNSFDYPAYSSYAGYQSSPSVVVVNSQPSAPSTPIYIERATPGIHTYDEYGQEVGRGQGETQSANSAPPLYLIAFQNGEIRAADAYWVDGNTLHYVTREHAERQAPLDTVDRDLSTRLNRERHVAFSLPAKR